MSNEIEKTTVGALTKVTAPDLRGTEHLTQADIQMPRLAIVQPTTKQLINEIEGFKFGHLFNSLTGEVYGPGPLEFCIVRADPPRYMEFYPMADGGGVKDYSVLPGDPRTQFTKDANGKSVPPAATMFYDFVILMLPTLEPIALSFKGTSLKVARQLNGLMAMRRKPCFAGKYVLGTFKTENSKGKFAVYTVKNNGSMEGDDLVLAEGAYESFQGKTIEIDRDLHNADEPGDAAEPAGGGDTTFDPAKM